MVDGTTKIFFFMRFSIIGIYTIGVLLSTEEMNLELAIKYALENSTTMKLAVEDKKIAHAQSVESRSAALPIFSGMASGIRNFMIA